jgi:hypothetical protein
MPPPTWQTLVLHNNRRVENRPAAQSALLDAPVVGTSGSGEAGDLNSYPRRAYGTTSRQVGGLRVGISCFYPPSDMLNLTRD